MAVRKKRKTIVERLLTNRHLWLGSRGRGSGSGSGSGSIPSAVGLIQRSISVLACYTICISHGGSPVKLPRVLSLATLPQPAPCSMAEDTRGEFSTTNGVSLFHLKFQ